MSPELNEMIRLTIPVIEDDDLAAVQDESGNTRNRFRHTME